MPTTIQLTPSEVTMLKDALDAWEKQVATEGIIGSLMAAVLCPKEHRDELVANERVEAAKAKTEQQLRRDQATLFRAKLIQAQAQASEHMEEEYAR